jgi:hypothetical protein
MVPTQVVCAQAAQVCPRLQGPGWGSVPSPAQGPAMSRSPTGGPAPVSSAVSGVHVAFLWGPRSPSQRSPHGRAQAQGSRPAVPGPRGLGPGSVPARAAAQCGPRLSPQALVLQVSAIENVNRNRLHNSPSFDFMIPAYR